MNHALTVGDLMETARTLESLAALLPGWYAGMADHARELAATLTRACAGAMAAVVREQAAQNSPGISPESR